MGGDKTCRFDEEDVLSAGGRTLVVPNMYITTTTFDPDGVVPLLNPQTGEPTGQTMTHAALYQALYSLYMQTAMARDAAAQAEAEKAKTQETKETKNA